MYNYEFDTFGNYVMLLSQCASFLITRTLIADECLQI